MSFSHSTPNPENHAPDLFPPVESTPVVVDSVSPEKHTSISTSPPPIPSVSVPLLEAPQIPNTSFLSLNLPPSLAPDAPLHDVKGKGLLFETGSSSGPREVSPSREPMLISSVTPLPTHSALQNPSLEDRHGLVVDTVVDALNHSPPGNQIMDHSSSEDSGSLKNIDDDMTLGHYHSDAKSRRAPSKRGTKPKKGRSSPLT